jgi:hypothetical protein
MRTHFLYISLLILIVLVFRCQNGFAPLPNQTESDLRKQATLAAACSSLADLIQAEAMTDPAEVVAAFRIETANLRTREPWLSIQQRIETQLRTAKNVKEQENVLRTAPKKTGGIAAGSLMSAI